MVRRGVVAATLLLPTLAVLSPAPSAAAQDYEAYVRAIDNVFDPEVIRIEPGRSVEWVNDGRSPHDVVADDESWRSETLEPGGEYVRTFDEPGVYPYFCSFHGKPGVGMVGTVVVGDVPRPGPTGDVGPGREPVPGGFGPVVHVP